MVASFWLLTSSCLSCVSSEAITYTSSPDATIGSILPVSAFIELDAVLIFPVNMARTLWDSSPAWFELDSVSAELPLDGFVTSFLHTWALPIGAGLRTSAQVENPPRTLNLRYPAAADGIETEKLLQVLLYEFFSRRQRRLRSRRLWQIPEEKLMPPLPYRAALSVC